MVIYEVNVAISTERYDEYAKWLFDHVKEILAIEGFQKAEIGKIKDSENPSTQKMRISYFIENETHLQNYIHQHAPRLRADAIARFGDHLSITRRIIENPLIVDIN